jgi:PPOX class probable F420-dependent enzyme
MRKDYNMSESSAMPPTSTPFGERVARRLREEKVAWLTTVGADGAPQPNPVWFLWEGDTILMYSLPHAARVANIKRNPRVSFNFDGDGTGENIIVIAGEARICPEVPSAAENRAYANKYAGYIADGPWGTPEKFAAKYTVPIRITPMKVRGN